MLAEPSNLLEQPDLGPEAGEGLRPYGLCLALWGWVAKGKSRDRLTIDAWLIRGGAKEVRIAKPKA